MCIIGDIMKAPWYYRGAHMFFTGKQFISTGPRKTSSAYVFLPVHGFNVVQ